MNWFGYVIEPMPGGYVFDPGSQYSTILTAYEFGLLKQVSQIELDVLKDYILDQLSPWEMTRFNHNVTSYSLKHQAENAVGFYVSEVLFRVVMRICRMDEKIIKNSKNISSVYKLPISICRALKNSIYAMPPTLLLELQKSPIYAPKSYHKESERNVLTEVTGAGAFDGL